MKAPFYVLLIVVFFTTSQVYAGQLDVDKAGINVVLETKESISIQAFEFSASQSRVSDYKRGIRKQRRLRIGNEMIELGFRTFELVGDTYCCSLFITAPIMVIGSGMLIWGALTKDPSNINRRR